MTKRYFILSHAQARQNALECVKTAPEGYAVTVAEPSRSLEANAAQWPILEAFSEQLQWPVNGERTWLSPEEWKDLLTAAFRKEVPNVALGLNGGMVLLGHRTSKFSKREFSDWLDFLHATAADRGVNI